MREVGEQQIGREVGHAHDGDDGIDDPVARLVVRERTPVVHQVEGPADGFVEPRFQDCGLRVAGLDHAAAVLVDRRGCDDQVHVFAHALLPEHQADFAAAGAELFPNARPFAQRRALLPKQHLRQILEKEPVGDDAVLLRQRGRAETRLRRAGDRGPHGLRGLELGQMRNEVPAERGDIDNEEFFRGGHADRFRERVV
jgi:hypothetical protein